MLCASGSAFFFHVRLTQNAVRLQKWSCKLHLCAPRSVPSDIRIIPKGSDESGFSTDNNFAFWMNCTISRRVELDPDHTSIADGNAACSV